MRRENDDSYSAYDLVEAQLGDRMTLLTASGAHDFVKDTEGEGALQGWRRTDGERALGAALKLSLMKRNFSGGSSLRTPGVVIRENLEVSVAPIDPGVPLAVQHLGAVVSILTVQHAVAGLRS